MASPEKSRDGKLQKREEEFNQAENPEGNEKAARMKCRSTWREAPLENPR